MNTILTALENIQTIKQVGNIQLLRQLTDQQSLQTHQMPAAIVLPVSKTAEPNAFIGGHHQRVSISLSILLLETIPQYVRDNFIEVDSLTNDIIQAVAGLANDDGSAWDFVSSEIDLSTGLSMQNQLTRITFSNNNHIHL